MMNKTKNPINIKRGKKARSSGRAFELSVRHNLESSGWIVSRWQNNIQLSDIEHIELVAAKPGPFRLLTTGFPDFIAYKPTLCGICCGYEVIGVECKLNNSLDRIEKAKVKWLLKNIIFNKIFIAKWNKERTQIIYEEVTNNE